MLSLRFLALVGLLSFARAYYTGDGTAYSGDYQKDATGKNACGYGNLGDHWEKWYAAMPWNCGDRGWSRGKCGACVRVRGTERGAPGDWVVVKLIDQCASCSCGDVDLSTRALQAATGYSWDRKKIEWEWTSCSGGGAKVSAASSKRKRAVKGRRGAKCRRNGDCARGFACSKRVNRCYQLRGRRLSELEA